MFGVCPVKMKTSVYRVGAFKWTCSKCVSLNLALLQRSQPTGGNTDSCPPVPCKQDMNEKTNKDAIFSLGRLEQLVQICQSIARSFGVQSKEGIHMGKILQCQAHSSPQ